MNQGPRSSFTSAGQADQTGYRPFSEARPWLTAGMLAVLGLEWLVFARRG
jgi:hypothetical protein